MRALFCGCLLAAAPVMASPAPVLRASAAREALDRELNAMVAAGELPNAQVLVAQDGQMLLSVKAGYSDLGRRRPLGENAIFRLYSMTKPITSVAIMMLSEEGRLSLDAPVGRYLPELADLRVYAGGTTEPLETVPTTRPVTIADLLLHRSGISYEFMGNTPVHQYYRRHGVSRSTMAASTADQAPPARTLNELVQRIGRAPLLHQPGERFSYGFSTTVLGAVIERVSGQGLDRFLKDRIFDPLEMRDTAFVLDAAHAARLVTGYAATPEGLKAVDLPATSEYRDPARLLDGGGGLAGTLSDYRHFAEMLANRGLWHGRRLLKPQSVDAMFTPRLRTGGAPEEDAPFGYGLAIGDAGTEAKGALPVGAGSWGGSANTYFFADPQHRAIAILMTNELTPGAFATRTYRLRALVNRAALEVIKR